MKVMVLLSGSLTEQSRTPLLAATISPASSPRASEVCVLLVEIRHGEIDHAPACPLRVVEDLEPAGVGDSPLGQVAGHRHVRRWVPRSCCTSRGWCRSC